MYEKEVVEQKNKIENMKAEGKDEYEIKKQVSVVKLSVSFVLFLEKLLKYVTGN